MRRKPLRIPLCGMWIRIKTWPLVVACVTLKGRNDTNDIVFHGGAFTDAVPVAANYIVALFRICAHSAIIIVFSAPDLS